jgi:integrase
LGISDIDGKPIKKLCAGNEGLWAKLVLDISDETLSPIERLTPHTLRHSFASLATDLGFADAVVGEIIGHKGNVARVVAGEVKGDSTMQTRVHTWRGSGFAGCGRRNCGAHSGVDGG